jgi:putative redox protein
LGDGKAFEGGPDGGVSVVVDGDATRGQAPMQLLLSSLAGCMAIDVQEILEKSRVPLESLEVDVVGVRAHEAPRRYVSVEMVFYLRGPGPEHGTRVQRAVDLSKDKYCSLLHTLDPGLPIDIRVERV